MASFSGLGSDYFLGASYAGAQADGVLTLAGGDLTLSLVPTAVLGTPASPNTFSLLLGGDDVLAGAPTRLLLPAAAAWNVAISSVMLTMNGLGGSAQLALVAGGATPLATIATATYDFVTIVKVDNNLLVMGTSSATESTTQIALVVDYFAAAPPPPPPPAKRRTHRTAIVVAVLFTAAAAAGAVAVALSKRAP